MVAKVKRRELLAGAASVAVLPGSVRPRPPDDDLVRLSLQFQQVIERTHELELRKCQLAPDADATWKAWSDAIDEAEAMAGQLQRYGAGAQTLLFFSLNLADRTGKVDFNGPEAVVRSYIKDDGRHQRTVPLNWLKLKNGEVGPKDRITPTKSKLWLPDGSQ